MTTEVLTQRSQLEEIRSDWDRLARLDLRDGFFRTPAWCLNWMTYIRPEDEPFVVVVRDESGTVVGIAPLCKTTFRDRGVRLSAISPMGREVVSGDYLDYACSPEDRHAVIEAVLDRLWNARSDWELLVGGELVEGGDLHRATESIASRQGLPLHRQEQRACLFIETPRSFDDYLSSLSQQMRYTIRRDNRDLFGRAGAHIQVCSDPADVCANLDTLITLHLAHWRSRGQPGTLGRPGFRAFLEALCRNPPEGAGTRLYLLHHDGKPAAALLAFCWGENMMFYQSGWDPNSSIARMRPGLAMVTHNIRDAIESGYRYFDFLRGDEAYKTRLTKTSRNTLTVLVARSFFAKEYLRALRLKDSVKRMMGRSESTATAPFPSAAAK